eukprot:363696-Chlamydomonas_euryale.AAC.22
MRRNARQSRLHATRWVAGRQEKGRQVTPCGAPRRRLPAGPSPRLKDCPHSAHAARAPRLDADARDGGGRAGEDGRGARRHATPPLARVSGAAWLSGRRRQRFSGPALIVGERWVWGRGDRRRPAPTSPPRAASAAAVDANAMRALGPAGSAGDVCSNVGVAGPGAAS